jgi:hypothetical protein
VEGGSVTSDQGAKMRSLAGLCVNNEARPRKDKRGVDLISEALPFGRLWYGEPNAISNAVEYAKHRSRSHDAVIRFTMKRAT